MNESHDPNRTMDVPSSETADSLDAGLAAGFGKQGQHSSLGELQRHQLREAEGESTVIVQPHAENLPDLKLAGDRYQLQGEIGRGGMGVVLRGRDVELGRELAVKVLLEGHRNRADIARRFVEEAQIGGQLQHPGVVPVYDIGRFGDRLFFTMKLVKGHTLATLLGNRPDQAHDLPRFLVIALQVFQTLAYAHARGVIHRDLKPANVMVGAFGEVQVMDWGLAKVLAEGGSTDENRSSRPQQQPGDGTTIRTLRSGSSLGSGSDTEAGSLLGTPAYMPPEQANGNVALVDRRSDVFGLGGMLCEILTGKPPYVGRNAQEVRRKAANADVGDALARLDASGADPELVALARTCLAPEPGDRPRDAQAVADALEAHLNGVQQRLQASEREREVAQARAVEERKRRRVQLALAAAVLALVLGGGVVAWWREVMVQAGRERHARNSVAVASLLQQAQEALQANETARASLILAAAHKRGGEGGAEDQTARLQSLQHDLALLQDLDAVDHFIWSSKENKLPDKTLVAAQIRGALAHFGADLDSDPLDPVVDRINASVVQERILAALDRLLHYQTKARKERHILGLLDANPYRDVVRNAIIARDTGRVGELAEKPEALDQPPGFASFLGENRSVKPERRRQLLRSALAHRPGNLSLLMTLGGTYPIQQQEGAPERIRWFQAAVTVAPDNLTAQSNLGIALMDQGQLDQAIDCFQRAITLDPKMVRSHVNLGAALAEKGQWDQAFVCYRKAIELDPQFAPALTNLGNALTVKDQLDQAIECFQRAIKLDPEYAFSQNGLGLAFMKKGMLNEAMDCYNRAINKNPGITQFHINLGTVHLGKNQPEKAIDCFQNAIKINSRCTQAYYHLGIALNARGRVDEAIDCYRKAIDLDPKFAEAHCNLGSLLHDRKGQIDEAIASFRQAITHNPKLFNAHRNLGIALISLGEIDEAIVSFRKAMELGPLTAQGYLNLGILLHNKKGNVKEAIECFQKAIELDPFNPQAHFYLGFGLRALGRTEEAIGCFRQTIVLDPNNSRAHVILSGLLANTGILQLRNPQEALSLATKATNLTPQDGDAWTKMGEALYRSGQYQQAISNLDKARALIKTDNAEISFFLGMAHHKAGNKDEARKWYDRGKAWMEKNNFKDPALQRYSAEAAEVLGVK